ncbi:DUF317 domain-containing protein [Streptomyces sp. UH6]|uniref:DUF317 domain-containing protein n=1 Tax=Streptomyces sp. UH6 TaxID=2748379 RepID=UPI0015D4CC17|nr:DUF317 domain-containing protein [Streptomyces sp. UH6]NYV73259.1 DUF317 domain-containing protein [Streptomyces sp. UH6]
MPLSKGQLASFAAEHDTKSLFNTSPRHLAGPGDGRHVTHGLAAAGWTLVSDPLNPLMVLRSDDVDRRLILDGTSHLYYWSLQNHTGGDEPHWYASFSYRTPVEIVAAVTDTLVTPPTEGAEDPDAWHTIRQAGWPVTSARQAHSPDGLCQISRLDDDMLANPWYIEVRDYQHEHAPHWWRTVFHGNTPGRLVHAFAAALTDSAPLLRSQFSDGVHHQAVQEPSRRNGQQLVEAHTSRLDVLRGQVRAARRRARAAARPTTSPPSRTASPATPAHR